MQDGFATFRGLSVSSAGTYQLLGTSLTPLRAATLTLPAVAAPKFQLNLAPAVAGQSGNGQPFTLTVQSPAGYLGTVRLTSSDPQVPPQTLVFQSSDNGSKTLTITLLTPGRQTMSVADATLPTQRRPVTPSP